MKYPLDSILRRSSLLRILLHPTRAVTTVAHPALRHRLLQDIAELQTQPYPNISLHLHDDDLSTACLILTVESYGPMHLTILFSANYPLTPPSIRMDSKVTHPNIKSEDMGHICASILDTQMDYTSAYTLKGIAIQLLSFFSSDRIQQVGGDFFFELDAFRALHLDQNSEDPPHQCGRCQFGISNYISPNVESMSKPVARVVVPVSQLTPGVTKSAIQSAQLPDEMLLMIFGLLETEELLAFAEAWSRVGDVVNEYNVIRTRELRCFCLKKGFLEAKLGVGVNTSKEEKGNMDWVVSEFDILSDEAFDLGVNRSIQGVPFKYWLPLPISELHWERVRDDVETSLRQISGIQNYGNVTSDYVLFKFLNDILIKLSKEIEQKTYRSPVYPYEETAKSTLTYASEKAIESYFHIFHLLVCIACEEPEIVKFANELLFSAEEGNVDKKHISNIGHFMIATLLADVDTSARLTQTVITEVITRNTIRVLQQYPELAYEEPTAVSDYRLQKTFDASKTSYSLLMFIHIFRRTALGSPKKPLSELRDNAFARYGAPPPGGAAYLADTIKEISQVDSFRDFLAIMGMPGTTKARFTGFLRERMQAAIAKGYVSIPFTQQQAMYLRKEKEPGVEVRPGMLFMPAPKPGKDGMFGRGQKLLVDL
ncbi:hypothetical protein LZ554_001227 [Drepanopeziza brunnea f. sp. 'monogermtubi']|nr:hypothetical protein LZ554_001227 [Drepanopeziza brunnea f. sp. 'monogermtubi']